MYLFFVFVAWIFLASLLTPSTGSSGERQGYSREESPPAVSVFICRGVNSRNLPVLAALTVALR